MSNCHMNWCMVTMAAPNNQGYLSQRKLQGRAIRDKVALIPNNLLGTMQALTLSPRNSRSPRKYAVGTHSMEKICTGAA
jgi:hypothetical protein